MKKILLLGLGGTIAGLTWTSSNDFSYRAAQLDVQSLLHMLPSLKQVLGNQRCEAEQLVQLDSKDMGFSVWQALHKRVKAALLDQETAGVVVTHGTDTLEETAYFLHAVLDEPLTRAKPVVLTCAMRPADALQTDGPQNLQDALHLAGSGETQGVVVVCAGQVHAAPDVQKLHPYRLDAFSSGDAGPLAYLEAGRLRQLRPWLPSGYWPNFLCAAEPVATTAEAESWPWVEIVFSAAGVTGQAVHRLTEAGVQGLVVNGTGNGSIHQDLLHALLKARSQGVTVVRTTRCAWGVVLPLDGDCLPDSQGLSAVKARIALMLALRQRSMRANSA